MNSSNVDEWYNISSLPPSNMTSRNNTVPNLEKNLSSFAPSSSPTATMNSISFAPSSSPSWDNLNTTNTTTVVFVERPTYWEGYVVGFVCLLVACGFVFVPTWYLDRRRHLDFVGDRAEARRRRRRERRNRRRRGIFGLRPSTTAQDALSDSEGSMEGRDEAYIMGMLLTKTAGDMESSDYPDGEKDKETCDSGVFVLDKNTDCCPICLHDYKAGEEVCFSKNKACQHEFHRSCIVPWLLKHYHCPLCRVNFLGDSEDEEDTPAPSSLREEIAVREVDPVENDSVRNNHSVNGEERTVREVGPVENESVNSHHSLNEEQREASPIRDSEETNDTNDQEGHNFGDDDSISV
eukprot:scaffold871_cov130-Cylindrotheca_fusiformis.AAC.42